jgi:predicted transcriptional regulator of viral defense system
MKDLRQIVNREEIDYVTLKSLLQELARPRDKITSLLRSGYLVRVKKGLYVFGPDVCRGPICKEHLANLIYGPSYISFEYALSYHGLTPERVEQIGSVTSKRGKKFTTPLGVYSYTHLKPQAYSVGVSQITIDTQHNVLFASAEKALADVLALSPNAPTLQSIDELEQFLFEDLRIERSAFYSLDSSLLAKIALSYRNSNVTFLARLLGGQIL